MSVKAKLMLMLTVTSLGSFAVHAQQAPIEAPERPVSQEAVQSFAAAYGSVVAIQQEYTQRLQQAQDQEEAQALQQEAQAKMVGAVEDAGVSVQQYNEMAARLEQDEALRQQVLSAIGQQP